MNYGYILKVKPQFSDGLVVVCERNRSQKQFQDFVLGIWKNEATIIDIGKTMVEQLLGKRKRPPKTKIRV